MTNQRTRSALHARVVAIVAALALVAAACGGGDEADGEVSAGDTGGASTDVDSSSSDVDSDSSGADSPAEETATPSESDPEPAEPVSEPAESSSATEQPADEAGEEATVDEPSAQAAGPLWSGLAASVAPDPSELTASWRGVTEDTITIGVSMLNFELLQEMGLTAAGWGDQQGVFQALVDDLNANGGILGRKVEAVYDYYSPIDAADAERACTVLTQDNEVFAAVLGFVGPLAGTADPCFAGTNNTPLVGGEQTPDELAQVEAPWFNVEPVTEDHTSNLLDLVVQTGRADGVRVFVVSHQASTGDEPGVIEALGARGIEVVGTAVLDANDGDTAAQDQLMQVISERIRADGADTVMINGNPAATIRGLGLNGLLDSVTIWSNNAAGLNNLGETFDHEWARGAIASDGPSELDIWNDDVFQDCVRAVNDAGIGADLRPTADLADDDENWFNPTRRYCSHLSLFVQIAAAAGPDLTPETFEQGAYTLTDFVLPGYPANSLSPTKLGARDLYRLTTFDPDVGNGENVPLTELVDIVP
ncbi:MAG: ABC transporter substrate-binding protein [Acidimicrobiia bacterium]|nr:ABC transporter substrate-binding protein [Acidimicrobiia bacterium]